MALDQFKTQVLLLHSEQSALDSLSSGFGDRYTVHCATSGVEALTTLGETPINVIISAQKLPGMSGVEALREAKKRSPETIGILLAGNEDRGIEALVGEKEVFRVVRGEVTGEGLKKLVDSATQQLRLMALAESMHGDLRHTGELRQCTRHLVRIAVALANRQEVMFPVAGGGVTQQFLDDEVFRPGPQTTVQHRTTMGAGEITRRVAVGHGPRNLHHQSPLSNTTAWAAMPSPRPV